MELSGPIEFNNISFSYPTRPDVKILDGLSLTVPAKQALAVVGGSGSGTETIVLGKIQQTIE